MIRINWPLTYLILVKIHIRTNEKHLIRTELNTLTAIYETNKDLSYYYTIRSEANIAQMGDRPVNMDISSK